MMGANYQNATWLHDKYVTEGWSTTDIGKFCGVSHKTICRWLDKCGIPTRDAQACQLTQSKRLKREAVRRSIGDYLHGSDRTTQSVETNKPRFVWNHPEEGQI